jgi:hypothetical protein
MGRCGSPTALYTGPDGLKRSLIKSDNPRREKAVSEQLEIAMVGGGLGGLTAALALRARGLNVTIFEQAGELREVGAGISIHPNAALLLQRIGLTVCIKSIGTPIASHHRGSKS